MTNPHTSTTPRDRTLILVRHAKAEQVPGKPDRDRELTPRGRKDARAVGAWLRQASGDGVLPSGIIDLALCSTSERTRQTIEEICLGGASVKETRFDQRIYEASAAQLLDVLHEVRDSVSTVFLIGHAPGVPVLAAALAQDGAGSAEAVERLADSFPTSGTALLKFEGPWSDLAPETARLLDFVVPRG